MNKDKVFKKDTTTHPEVIEKEIYDEESVSNKNNINE